MSQPEGEKGHVLVTPLWVFVVRIFQILVSLAILGLAADLAHDAYLDEEGLALAVVSRYQALSFRYFGDKFQTQARLTITSISLSSLGSSPCMPSLPSDSQRCISSIM
jgi:hypothetical protein